jgi:DNA-binding LytR/AlgR family response regulator
MINCIVVDDEPLARQLILSYISRVPGMECVGEYKSAVDAFAALHAQNVDVIFVDIEMPGISGLNFIRSLKKTPAVVFITAYTQYAVDAFEIDAVDYLVKPVTMERFLKTVRKLIPTKDQQTTVQQPPHNSSIFLKVDRRLVRIDLGSIMYAEALGDYLKVHCRDQVLVVYLSLGKLEALLPVQLFIRIHRSTIVNKQFIQFIEANFVRIKETDLPIGLTYRDRLLESLGNGEEPLQ